MKREFSLATAEFEERLEKLNYALRKENDSRVHRALTIERAEAMGAMAKLTVEKRKEFASFQEEQGIDAAGRIEDLSRDWWNDEEVDAIPNLKSSPTFARD